MDFQYQLVVTRAYDEGEEQLLEEDAESESTSGIRRDGELRYSRRRKGLPDRRSLGVSLRQLGWRCHLRMERYER